MQLPDCNAPSVKLTIATPEEAYEQQRVNSIEWKGALPLEGYLRREAMLVQQRLTQNGGLTSWALVHEDGESGRVVLSACETIKKKAFVAKDGQVKDVICHGVCSVFCPLENRGKGYAGRMITELGERLATWQTDKDNEEILFSVLWSDIGKQFYNARGWHPFPSAHISLHPTRQASTDLPAVRLLETGDLGDLCTRDEQLMRGRVAQEAAKGKTAVAIVPDLVTLEWHHAREDFVGIELYGKTPSIKGAIVEAGAGKRVWCIWTRMWYNSDPRQSKDNTLHILRLVVEDEGYTDYEAASEQGVENAKGSGIVAATAALLAAAQAQAKEWNMGEVDIWNPTSATVAAARMLDESVKVVHREKDSISSLRWYGEGSEDPVEHVEWIGNEKYGWC